MFQSVRTSHVCIRGEIEVELQVPYPEEKKVAMEKQGPSHLQRPGFRFSYPGLENQFLKIVII